MRLFDEEVHSAFHVFRIFWYAANRSIDIFSVNPQLAFLQFQWTKAGVGQVDIDIPTSVMLGCELGKFPLRRIKLGLYFLHKTFLNLTIKVDVIQVFFTKIFSWYTFWNVFLGKAYKLIQIAFPFIELNRLNWYQYEII